MSCSVPEQLYRQEHAHTTYLLNRKPDLIAKEESLGKQAKNLLAETHFLKILFSLQAYFKSKLDLAISMAQCFLQCLSFIALI